MTNKFKPELNAVVFYARGTGKCRWVTRITIRIGDLPVAKATLGGWFTPIQALAEFRKTPERFQRLVRPILQM